MQLAIVITDKLRIIGIMLSSLNICVAILNSTVQLSTSWRQSCIAHWMAWHHPTWCGTILSDCRPPTVVWHAVHATSVVITDQSAGCPPVTVCNCQRPRLHHCWCSVVERFANRHCCVWHTSTVPL